MKQVAIFNEILDVRSNGRVNLASATVDIFNLNQKQVACGLVETTDTPFDGALPKNHDRVLVRKKAFSCNYRDKSITLKAKLRVDSYAKEDLTKFFTLGSEFVGEVVAVGKKVTRLKVGDHVIGNGAYPFSDHKDARPGLPTNNGSKELEVFHFSKLLQVPLSMPIEVAAAFPIGGQTAYSMIRRLNLQAGEKVLVTAGTSNTSLFAINALQQHQVSVYAVTTREKFVPELKKLGVKEVFVVKRGLKSLIKDEKVAAFVKENGYFNAVIDPLFDIYLPQVMDVIALEGRYITCGLYKQFDVPSESGKEKEDQLRNVMVMAMIKNISLIGNCIGTTADLRQAVSDYEAGKLDVVIDTIYRNNDVGVFFDRSFNSKERFGKVIYAY